MGVCQLLGFADVERNGGFSAQLHNIVDFFSLLFSNPTDDVAVVRKLPIFLMSVQCTVLTGVG